MEKRLDKISHLGKSVGNQGRQGIGEIPYFLINEKNISLTEQRGGRRNRGEDVIYERERKIEKYDAHSVFSM